MFGNVIIHGDTRTGATLNSNFIPDIVIPPPSYTVLESIPGTGMDALVTEYQANKITVIEITSSKETLTGRGGMMAVTLVIRLLLCVVLSSSNKPCI
ncbi:hypothetical protein ACE8FZ_03955 [Peribacillus frigoritolerans]|uniref:hypothetical protein n=1 Tax=Peribacillus frigoritolerans TaxID=450367 RepID=UPI0035CFAED7